MKDFTQICMYLEACGMAASGVALLGIAYHFIKALRLDEYWEKDEQGRDNPFLEEWQKEDERRGQ